MFVFVLSLEAFYLTGPLCAALRGRHSNRRPLSPHPAPLSQFPISSERRRGGPRGARGPGGAARSREEWGDGWPGAGGRGRGTFFSTPLHSFADMPNISFFNLEDRDCYGWWVPLMSSAFGVAQGRSCI